MRLPPPVLTLVVLLRLLSPVGGREHPAPGPERLRLGLGLASGTGSPHLYDQQPLFTAFRYKSALFRPSAAGGTQMPKAGLKITRDDFGVPAIEGATENDAWWGAGYAVAQDRLFQIELFRRAATGRLAEILGRLAYVRLRRAGKEARGDAAAVLGALNAWSGDYRSTDGSGTVDPGVEIWEEFKDQLERRALTALGVEGDEAKDLAGSTGASHAFNITNGEALALRSVPAAGYRAAADATFRVLAERFKTRDLAAWREKRRLYDVSSQGAGSAPELPFFDRGTWEQFVEVGP